MQFLYAIIRKLALSGAVIGTFIFYGLHQRSEDAQALAVLPTNTSLPLVFSEPPLSTPPIQTPTPTVIPTPTTAPIVTPTTTSTVKQTPKPIPTATIKPSPTPIPIPAGQYKNGIYTGAVANAYYGNVEVQATVQGMKVTTVTFLQYPNTHSTSRSINAHAMPILQQEAIQAQSAQVDSVSGASLTSKAFVESLTVALGQAQ